MSIEPSFSTLLRQSRRSAGLTQEQLAEKAGMSVRGLQHLEAGEVRPFHATLWALIGALDLDGDDRMRLQSAAGRSLPMPSARGYAELLHVLFASTFATEQPTS